MEEVKFNLDTIDKTFTKYKKNEIFDGVVVLKRDDGVIFNQAFHRHTAVLVMGEAVSDNCICDLVTDLIHMATGYLL